MLFSYLKNLQCFFYLFIYLIDSYNLFVHYSNFNIIISVSVLTKTENKKEIQFRFRQKNWFWLDTN